MSLNSIERSVITDFRKNEEIPKNIEANEENILKVCLSVVLQTAKLLRTARIHPDKFDIEYKSNNSPVSNIDKMAEELIKRALFRAFPNWGFLGEETGGEIIETNYSAAVDPIDGTWSFISHDSTSALSLSIFHNRNVILGIVLNPSTGEIGYAQNKSPTRLIQMATFGEIDTAANLPSINKENKNILINIQPSTGHRKLENTLKNAWDKEQIKFVKSMGGSPANALLEAAKGHYSYVHPWKLHPTTPYDISAGVKLVENAGGSVIDLKKNNVNVIGHTGTFVASIHSKHQKKIINILK